MICPYTGKTNYSKKDGQTYVNAHPDKHLRIYNCKCGAWHLTHKDLIPVDSKQRRIINQKLFKKYLKK